MNKQDMERLLGHFEDLGVSDVLGRIANEQSVSIEVLLGRSRTATIAHARRELYIALREAGLSLPEIGKCCDRDHTTVMVVMRYVPVKARERDGFALGAQCANCDASFATHMQRAPHPLPQRGCAGFVERRRVVA